MLRRYLVGGLALALAACGTRTSVPEPGRAAAAPAAIPARAAHMSARYPARFASAPDRGGLVAYVQSPGTARRLGAYTWRRADLSEAHARAAIAGRLSVATPDGATLRFRYTRHVEHSSGDWTWVGELEGGSGGEDAIVTFGPKAVFGLISRPGRPPLRLTTLDGTSWVVETDAAAVALIDNHDTKPVKPDFLVPPASAAAARPTSAAVGADMPSPASYGAGSKAGTVVDLAVGYTNGFAAGLGGTSQATTRINFLVDVANQAFQNSQVDLTLRLVRTQQVNYPDATKNDDTLRELTSSATSVLAQLRSLRDEYGADLVTLVRKFNTPENDGCGVAWLIGAGQQTIDVGDSPYGYSVVSDGSDTGNDGKTYFCRDETLAHEVGHNMGSQHDRDNADGDDNVLQSSEYGRYPYSFGYKTSAGSGNFFTVMAYGDAGQTRYRVFSNPRINYCGGLACGVADQADNARSLNQTAPMVASFRAMVVPNPGAALAVRDDLNGDGRSDLIFRSADNSSVAFWLMNDSQPTSSFSSAVSSQWRVAANGDFNGDGKFDVLWTNDVQLVMWLGAGTGFTATVISSSSSGWRVVGAGDVDGDGKHDLFLRSNDNSQIRYWRMNGAEVSTVSSASSVGPQWRVAAVEDFSGDGRADLIWTNDSQLVAWVSNGSSFDGNVVAASPSGWRIVGAGDLNADGRADLVLRSADSTAMRYWLMDGAQVLAVSTSASVAAQWRVGAVGDYNGDKRTDVIWTNDQQLVLWASTGTGFDGSVLPNAPAGLKPINSSVPQTVVSRYDVDGDGKADVFLRNSANTTIAYWLMNGNQVIGNASWSVGPQWRVATIADLSGDGRADIVWTNDSQLVVWVSNGASFESIPVANSPVGWRVVGAGDINGDGKADLVLRNVGNTSVQYWLMNGAQVLGTAAWSVGTQWRIGEVADYNGDGKADLLWTNDSQFIIWASNGSSFDSVVITRDPSGWTIAGVGDLNGDGRTDLVLRNAANTSMQYWLLNGSTVINTAVWSVGPSWRVATVADFSGDGKADIMWTNDIQLLGWISDGVGFTGAAVSNSPAGLNVVNY